MAQIKPEQLQQVNEFKLKFNELTFIIGQNQIQQRQLKIDEQNMFEELERIALEEQNFLGEIQKEYGDGNLDTNTGEFTPTNTK
jgi:hypothetical protein